MKVAQVSVDDGDRFAILIDDVAKTSQSAMDLYMISRDGESSRLTFLSDKHPYSRIDEYSWSPDGRYIALWWTNDSGTKDGLQFIVLETQTGKTVNYCMPNYPNGQGSKFGAAVEPVWSPYGEQILIDNIPSKNGIRNIILIDLARGLAAKIGEGRTPMGWMVEP